jgi:hypothetical protein
MTDWIEHTGDTCPVDPETVVEVRYGSGLVESDRANKFPWWMLSKAGITHYRIITPAPTPPLFLGGDPAKPPEPDMTRRYDAAEAYAERRVRPEMNADAAAALKRQLADAYRAGEAVQELKVKALAKPPEPEMAKTAQEHAAAMVAATKPEPDLITLRLECMKMAVSHFSILDREQAADRLLHYVLNGSVDKA